MSTSSVLTADEVPVKRIAGLATGLVLGISAVTFLVHVCAGRHYGYFVDELYTWPAAGT